MLKIIGRKTSSNVQKVLWVCGELDLPFEPVLIKTKNTQEQKDMANNVQQALNIDGSLAVLGEQLRGGPVLLVNDMVDSRWTLTAAAWLLQEHGSGIVRPLALAQTGGSQ